MPLTQKSSNASTENRSALHESVTVTLTDAFFAELAEVGYGRLTLEAVARRAGSGKAAIYRRWSSKETMLIELMGRAVVTVAHTPDTGSLFGDVSAFLTITGELLLQPRVFKTLPDLLASQAFHPTLAAALQSIGAARRSKVVAILERAIARGELSSSMDLDLGLDLLAGPLYWGVIVRQNTADSDQRDRLTRMIVAALKSGSAEAGR